MENLRQTPPEKEYEKKIDKLLLAERLPAEIIEKWEHRFSEEPLDVQFSALNDLIEKRHRALSISESNLASPSHVEVVDTEPLAVQAMLSKLEHGAHERIGEGLSGRVIASLRNPRVCYKVFFAPHIQPMGTNDIAAEADLQKDVFALGDMHGVRVPEVNYFIKHGTVRAIAMERLNAVSIKDVLEGEAALPPAFDIEVFFDSLKRYIDFLHDKGFYHRDLHGGNVMIDCETGRPYVIDFGHATKYIGEEGVYQAEVVKSGRRKHIVLLSDEEAPKLLKTKIAAFLTRKDGV